LSSALSGQRHDQRSPEEKARLAERQRQVELAEARGEVHVGARMAEG